MRACRSHRWERAEDLSLQQAICQAFLQLLLCIAAFAGMVGGFVFLFLVCYSIKCLFGIDIYPEQHLKDFVSTVWPG